jgi:hypothetical protein
MVGPPRSPYLDFFGGLTLRDGRTGTIRVPTTCFDTGLLTLMVCVPPRLNPMLTSSVMARVALSSVE